MGVALVTGLAEKQAEISALLRAAGHDLVDGGQGAGGRPFDCYVQLPEAADGRAATAEIADRVADVATLADRLADRATVVLVTNGWDWRERNALRLLAEASLASSPAREAGVVVLDSMADVAATVAAGRPDPARPSLADLEPDRGFADWRDDMLTLAGETERTYFGWPAAGGAQRVAVLAGSVMSPVRPLSGRALRWGSGQDCSGLAAALLADTLGPEAVCPACAGSIAPCLDCHGQGLSAAARPLAEAFVAEVVAVLPAAGFEMRVSDVLDWAGRQPAATPVSELVRRPRRRPVANLRRLAPTLV